MTLDRAQVKRFSVQMVDATNVCINWTLDGATKGKSADLALCSAQ